MASPPPSATTEPAAPGGTRRLRATRHGRGVCRRRRAGDRDVRLRDPGEVRAGRRRHRPGQRLRRCRQADRAGIVGIDAEARATEIGILADSTADPRYVAADLISQAEHDPLAACLLVTDSRELVDAVEAEVDPASRRHPSPGTGYRRADRPVSGGVRARPRPGLDGGRRVGRRAPGDRHREASAEAARVRNAGAIFVGPYAPVTFGDYLAGSNHVLPTGGTARFTSGLSVLSFLHGIHVVDCLRAALAGWPATSTPLAARRICCPRRSGAGEDSTRCLRRTSCRCGPTCGACRRTARRSSTSRYGSTPTRIRIRRPSALVADIAATVAGVAATFNRYPDRDAVTCAPSWRATSGLGSITPRCGRPTGPTRCCSSCCRCSAVPASSPSGSNRRTRCTG